LILIGKILDRDLLPVAEFCELYDWPCETFAALVFGAEGNAEVADTRVVEVLPPADIAYVPTCTSGVVFSLA
jgi:hypothetical protein